MNNDWTNYMIKAAQHSKGSAAHWFRYLRKDVNNYGKYFGENELDALINNELLTFFQRVSLKAAFTEGTPTRSYIIELNNPIKTKMVDKIKELSGNDRL